MAAQHNTIRWHQDSIMWTNNVQVLELFCLLTVQFHSLLLLNRYIMQIDSTRLRVKRSLCSLFVWKSQYISYDSSCFQLHLGAFLQDNTVIYNCNEKEWVKTNIQLRLEAYTVLQPCKWKLATSNSELMGWNSQNHCYRLLKFPVNLFASPLIWCQM